MGNQDLSRLWPEAWAGQASAHAASIEAEAEVAFKNGQNTAHRAAARHAIQDLLGQARKAAEREIVAPKERGNEQEATSDTTAPNDANRKSQPNKQSTGNSEPRRPRRRLADRWRGTSVEWAHYHLHAAKTLLVELSSDEDVDARVPAAIARIDTALDPQDVRRLHLDQLEKEQDRHRKRAGLKQAMEIGYDAADQMHSRVRGFRNMLYKAALAIGLLMFLLVVVVSLSPQSLPLCFDPTAPSSAATRSDSMDEALTVKRVCPSGEDHWVESADGGREVILREPSPADIIIVAGLGLLGGALSTAFAIRKVRGTATPYDVPLALAVLKMPIGALTAVTGMLLLAGGFVPGLSQLDSQDQILAYALLFGYAQQLGTQYIDQRAESILNSVPSKDAESNRPTRSAAAAGEPMIRLRSPRPTRPQGRTSRRQFSDYIQRPEDPRAGDVDEARLESSRAQSSTASPERDQSGAG